MLSTLLVACCGAWAFTAWNGRGISDLRVRDAAIVAKSYKYVPASRAAAVLQLHSEATRVLDTLRSLRNDPEIGASAKEALDSLVKAFEAAK